MSDISESYHDCLFVPGSPTSENGGEVNFPVNGDWNVCVRPTEVCLAAMRKVEAKLAAVKRLRALAELCGSEVLDLSRLIPGDILHLYASRPGVGYGQIVGRALAVRVRELQELRDEADPMAPAIVVRGNVVTDSYNGLPPTDSQRGLAVPEGSDVSILGSWNNGEGEKRTRFGLLAVGSLAVYEITKHNKETGYNERHAHGMMLQEVAITDPAGVGAVMWDTDPLAFREASDFMNVGWKGETGPTAGTLD
jgi:hypothetical protein